MAQVEFCHGEHIFTCMSPADGTIHFADLGIQSLSHRLFTLGMKSSIAKASQSVAGLDADSKVHARVLDALTHDIAPVTG